MMGAGRLASREPLERTRMYACTTGEQTCSCRWVNNKQKTISDINVQGEDPSPPNICTAAGFSPVGGFVPVGPATCPSRQARRFDTD